MHIANNRMEPIMKKPKRINYLNNKDMMLEVHRSKLTFCDYANEEDSDYDIIVEDLNDLSKESIMNEARKLRADRIAMMALKEYYVEFPDGEKKIRDFKIDPEDIDPFDIVIRLITWDHIPYEMNRKKTHKTEADTRVKLNFVPFMHYRFKSREHMEHALKHNDFEDYVKVVLKSHHKDGKFSLDHGQITDTLSKMYLMMVNRYGEKGNWRGYSYLDDMKGRALIELTAKGLFFNELKSSNPFSYLTQVTTNGFRMVLNDEKKNQNIRDDLLEYHGQSPSIARQVAAEEGIRLVRDDVNNDNKTF